MLCTAQLSGWAAVPRGMAWRGYVRTAQCSVWSLSSPKSSADVSPIVVNEFFSRSCQGHEQATGGVYTRGGEWPCKHAGPMLSHHSPLPLNQTVCVLLLACRTRARGHCCGLAYSQR